MTYNVLSLIHGRLPSLAGGLPRLFRLGKPRAVLVAGRAGDAVEDEVSSSSSSSLYLLLMYAILGFLGAFLLFYPATMRNDVSFLLSKETVDLTQEATRMHEVVYRGQDNQGRSFALSVENAVQQSTKIPILHMINMSGDIELANGPASIFAAEGTYDIAKKNLSIDGAVRFSAPDGYRLTVNNVNIDLKSRAMQSRGRVEGSTNFGHFSADQMFADFDKRVLRLDGGVRMVMRQRGARPMQLTSQHVQLK